MRVVCIKSQPAFDPINQTVTECVVGVIYTVLNTVNLGGRIFYTLVEMDHNDGYFAGCFIPIIENQQDETEMERNTLAPNQITNSK